ncbi:hypothetical protein Asulf_00053 [Archaeoglobus sulfaticallidus PM70-1]|uniref:Membrane protein involved in the export of O-antigen and teichoic acid n=1 Tax=Archaeoglobus sulfaticallidus PM70-1 TaxID=387631 RepID=N0B8Z3_9EURY|nr:oligosaccharide flippase family protein [Archaeoglobus sulfaticallidus]AGK60089.1 hypothetical protein Asulf_00053 [Archaeoglobus sulfaticallidus PM70-1]
MKDDMRLEDVGRKEETHWNIKSNLQRIILHIRDLFIQTTRIITSKEKLREHARTPLYENAYYLMAGSVVSASLGLIYWIVIARIYSPAEIGLASALISTVGMLSSFSLLGFNLGLVRFLPEDEDKNGTINSCLTMSGLISMMLSIIFISGITLWMPKLLFLKENMVFSLLFTFFAIIGSILFMQRYVFIAFRSVKFNFLQQIIANVLKIPLAIVLISLGVLGIFLAYGSALLLAVILGNVLIRIILPGYSPLPTIKKKVINDMLHYSFANYVAGIFGGISNFILPLMVLSILGAEANAYFTIAFTASMMVFTVPCAIATSLFAEGSNVPEKLRINAIRSIKLSFILLIPLSILIFLFGDKILLLFGRAYSENAFKLLSIFIISAVPISIIETYVSVERVRRKVGNVLVTYVIMATSTIVMSYLLMTRIGLVGVGIGWLIGTGIAALVVTTRQVRFILEM